MSATTTVSVEEYLARTEKPYCEYVDGVLFPKATPTLLHGLLENILVALLKMQGLQAVPEVTVRLSPRKYLVPDVIAAPALQNPYPTEPVTLCVEILSPSDRVGAMLAKCEEYHAWGVPYCWIVRSGKAERLAISRRPRPGTDPKRRLSDSRGTERALGRTLPRPASIIIRIPGNETLRSAHSPSQRTAEACQPK